MASQHGCTPRTMMRAMKILVIGGTLFIGRETVHRLVEPRTRGDGSASPRPARPRSVDPQRASRPRRYRGRLADCSEGRFDAVVDMVYDWEKGTPAEQVEATARSGGDGLRRLSSSCRASRRTGPGSTIARASPLVPDDTPNLYAQQKASSERALFRLHAESGVPVTTFRPPFVHGPRQPFYREAFFWDRLLDGRPIVLPDGGECAHSVGVRAATSPRRALERSRSPRRLAKRSTSRTPSG